MAENQIELRDKDRALADRCLSAAAAATEAVDWLDRNREPSASISNLQKLLRRQAVEARRLGVAAARPMSVGVFGASQMGKSFLIGKLINPARDPVHVVFGEGADAIKQDFLEEVNPSGGDETTGLVTRFSLRSYKTPPGNPVVLRMLREVDIVKILANTFRFDLKGQYRIVTDPAGDAYEDRTPSTESISELADKLATLKKSEPQPGMAIEDVYELKEYVQKHLDDHALGIETEASESYWNLLETLAPHLDAAGRVVAMSPLWAGLEEFDALYSQLKTALDQLAHPERVFTGLDALKDRSRGVLHVNTLRDLDATGGVESLSVVSDANVNATLPMCVVTALTAELCVTLENAPWPFFTHTDLLDFPGARSRENKTVHEFLRDPNEATARANCFLRGKVAVLFDNYAAELDLNVMLLCAGPENQEVKTLSNLVREWVTRTHGDTPSKRERVQTGLFYCLTKSDLMLGRKVGQEEPVKARLENNLGPYAWWVDEWHPGKPFDNVFFIRNPKAAYNTALFTYEPMPADAAEDHVPPETGLADDLTAYLDGTFRSQFMSNALVSRHVAEPETKLEEVLRINDGGTSNLAGALAPVCNPDLKYDQISPRAETAISLLGGELSGYYESGDLEKRVTERKARIGKLIAALRKKPMEIGPFIASFQVDASLMEAAYRHFRRTAVEEPGEEDVFGALFEDEDNPDGDARSPSFGRVLVEWWARHLSEKVPESPWCDRLNVDEEAIRGLVEELVIGAERTGVSQLLEDQVDGFTTSSMRLDAAARRVSIFASMVLNDLVNLPLGRMPEGAKERFKSQAFPPDQLPEAQKQMERIRLVYFRDWMEAIVDLTIENASWGTGGAIDVEANAEMGAILAKLGVNPDE